MNKVMRLTFASSLSKLCEINSSFDSAVLRVAYTDANRNGSFISKDTYEKCIQTIYNCPIVCNYDRDTDTIGSHDVEVVVKDNSMKMVNITTPVGVVPESAQPYWEYVEEDDGSVHEYLCVDVLLWKRQEAYQKIKNDGITSESMEISVKQGGVDKGSGLFVIKDFEFTAFCLLGDGVTPCFESASLEVFSTADFKTKMSEMMSELKETFTKINAASPEADVTQQNSSTEGGDVLDEKMALVEEYGLTVEALDFSIDDFTVEELREKFEAMNAANVDGDTDPAPENFELEGQMRDVMIEALEAEKIDTVFGEMPRYWFVDYDRERSEVYAYDETDWKLCGFSYSMNGDNVVIDFESKKRMKFSIVDFDEGEQADPFNSAFTQAVEKFQENDTAWSEKYAAAQDEISTLRNDLTELDELRQFKMGVEADRDADARDAVFAKFTELDGIDEFETLRANNAGYSIEALEEKCYAIKGRNGVTATFAANQNTNRIVVPKNDADDEPYGGFIRDYKNK